MELHDQAPSGKCVTANYLRVLTVELYLKAMVVEKNNGTPPKKIHTLSELFSFLSPAHQLEIETLYRMEFDAMPPLVHMRDTSPNRGDYDLIPILEYNDNTFSDIRYSYELDESWQGRSLQPVRHAVRQVILRIHPEWRPLTECLDRLSTLQHLYTQGPVVVSAAHRPAGSQ
jgi:hypothetical protein